MSPITMNLTTMNLTIPILFTVLLMLAGCSPKGVLNSEQTTKAIMALGTHYNDLAKKHNALVDRVTKLEPVEKKKK